VTENLGLLVIHLDKLGCIDLLSSFSRVLIPAMHWQKVQRHRPNTLALPCFNKKSAPKSDPPELEECVIMPLGIDPFLIGW
jgi:hypothetical protein